MAQARDQAELFPWEEQDLKVSIPSEIKPPLTAQPKWGDVLLIEYSDSAYVFDGRVHYACVRHCFRLLKKTQKGWITVDPQGSPWISMEPR